MNNIPDKYKGVKAQTTLKVYGEKTIINHHIDHIGHCITVSKKPYEFEMLDYIRKNIPSKGTYIDVGANIGNHSIFFAKFCADKVISIEPIKENYRVLEKNLIDNKIQNCVTYNKGISIDGRSLGVSIVAINMGSCNLIEGGTGVETIKAKDLDVENLTLIKIDCEKMSMEVLKSFLPLIEKHNPHIFIEATSDELKLIKELTGYRNLGKFNATPTYHLAK